MNIAIISPQIYPCVTGGVEIFNYYFIKELAKRGHKIYVFSYCNQNFENHNIISVNLNRKLLLHPVYSLNFQIIYHLTRLKNNIDIIHMPYTSNSPMVDSILLAKYLLNIPYIVIIHGGGLYPWKRKRLHKSFFQSSSVVIAVSSPIKQEYEIRSGKTIELIPPLIPFKKASDSKKELKTKHGFNADDKIILCLGSIKEIKGSHILLEAFLALGEEYVRRSRLKLVFVGDGPLKSVLKKSIENTKLNEFIKFFGKVPNEKVFEFYQMSDIYVIPSFFEGMPISMLEAMFNGLPIIGTDVKGINSIISHKKNGLLFSKGDSLCLANCIKELVENKNLCVSLGEFARDTYLTNLTNYSFESMVSSHLKLYESTLESKYE